MTTITKSIEFLKPLIDSHFAQHHHAATKPLIIGISGPQGSGKSYLSSHLSQQFSTQLYPHLTTIDISTDDFYLTNQAQRELASNNATNWLVSGRGPPGTHDLSLMNDFLQQVIDGVEGLKIPRYDKSAYGGQGDRKPMNEWTQVQGKIDILIVEGWFNGFRSINGGKDVLLEKWEYIKKAAPATNTARFTQRVSTSDIVTLNESLQAYEESIWSKFKYFIYLSTDDLNNVYRWRLEQEHSLKASNGGHGMSDEQVKDFVDRYMPCYALYYDKLNQSGCLPEKRNLKLQIDVQRNVLKNTIV